MAVTREDSDTDLPISPNEWWGPDNPPVNEDSPYYGSNLLVSFNPPSEVMSVIITNEDGVVEEVRLAFQFQPSDITQFKPLEDEAGSPIFVGNTESEIPLPSTMPAVTKVRVYVVGPIGDTSYKVTIIGCEEKGNFSLRKNID